MNTQTRWIGFVLVLLGASFWGIGGTVAQRLFQGEGISVDWLVSVRLLVAGLIMIIIALLTHSNAHVFHIWKDKRAVKKLVIFGLCGMLAVQYTYMASISLGNAAVATLLQYLAPVFIIFYLIITKVSKLKFREILAVSLALTGTFFLLTNGSVDTLSVPFSAVVWGVLSGVALAFYTLYAGQLLDEWGSLNVIGWAMIIGGTVLGVFHQPWDVDMSGWTLETLIYLFFVVIFGTMIAFWFYLESLKYLKPQETSLLGSVEPLAAIWLQIPFGAFQMLGAGLILFMVIYLSIAEDKSEVAHIETQ
ncbi:EamA family transporter [Caldalkalibacillus salinus]|uniref:EamA family transporter n=1 Tax=Caldalkalibacillus salinus TaxID=2803787 RepID=UPI001924F757|nr:DMT family transporter [Caldalkalibacillus salinus]